MAATLAEIRKIAQTGALPEAESRLRGFLAELFPLDIATVEIRRDTLSLNSVNGFVRLASPEKKAGARALFFKFHQEDKEEGLGEYYNSQLLAEAGFPVETPLYVSRETGRQVLLYPLKTSERLADLCKRLELAPDETLQRDVVAAQERLDRLCCEKYLASLHQATPAELAQEPILQLFFYRLVDGRPAASRAFGGRYASFYAGKKFELPGATLSFDELSQLQWRVNGVAYKETLARGFDKALALLSPQAHGRYAAVTAHGDAHNGNVWYNADKALSLFDPAFAGKHIPALLAEIKASFHNIYAHPLWLYDSALADPKLEMSMKIANGFIDVTHNWRLSALRAEFLRAKRDLLWKPLLAALKAQGLLPANWEAYMRAALFCCPALVMNLRAHAGTAQNFHTPKTSLLGLCVSVMLSSSPSQGEDAVSTFFSALRAHLEELP